MDSTCIKIENFHIFENIMQSLPNKDQTRQNKRLNSHTPKPTRCLSPSNNTKPQASMQKTKQGVAGRGRQYLGQVVNGMNTLEKSIKCSSANDQ